ncbi:Rne/Rng family ribonuclease [Nonomuraea africana]|uniref:Ribonuclease E n=1 Tax=Nonomuraea africana TaxID=46171 RepID=A0ABR9K770_9ACTN|nr:Rne/Rng family ribonuclease [Nonomuraea africana]MBE1557855.1 ribonuclease E [Nonomuraea africana]
MLDNEPNAGAHGPDGDTTQQPTTPKRRRAASRPAGPPPEVDDVPAVVVTTQASGDAGAASTDFSGTAGPAPATAGQAGEPSTVTTSGQASLVEEAVAEAVEAPAPKRAARSRSTATTTTRRRTSKKAAEAAESAAEAAPAPAEALATANGAEAQAGALADEWEAPALPAEQAVEQPAEQPAAEEAAPKRRRTRKKAEPEQEPESPVEAVMAEELLETLPESEPLDDEPAGEDLDEEPIARPALFVDPFGLSPQAAQETGTAFQRPAAVFTPLFQAPDPSQAQPVRVEPQQPVKPRADEADALLTEESAEEAEEDVDSDDTDHEDDGGSRRRRRRRGGRGRGKSRERDDDSESDDSDEQEESEEGGEEAEEAEEAHAEEEESSSSRRRRRRRRRGGDEVAEVATDDPPNTVVRIRAPRTGRSSTLDTHADGVQSVRGSTRLEAKKQRRREGRELGRRRPPIITESEFLARRESVDRMMVVRRNGDRTQIAVLEDGILVEHYVNREASQSYVGNVYLGKVQNVLPSMEAAFVDIGKGRNAVLYAGEVNFDTAGLEGQPKRIEAALKSGQSVLVQVTKDPMGHKGARLTSQISLPGRYLVYVPDGSMTGISRKLPDKERTRLKSILKKVMPENAGVIVRTAAEGASEEELGRDVARLSAQWEAIQKKAKSASPPELLSSEPDLTIRVVRDVFNEDFSSLVVQGEDAWDTVEEYVKYVAPHLADRLGRWDEDGDVFEAYRIDEQLAKALDRKVWLPSGGSLVIDRTEAMTVVDVNTGKFTGQGGNLEETVTRNNLEAAEEIVRQLRLRDIGGIIVIDFIDMVLESNRDLVLRRLLECLARDRTKHQVAEVTSLGLVQMTRKRVGQGLLEAFSTQCECCNGRGLIVSAEPVEGKPEPRGTQGKMAVEKAVAEKVSAANDSAGRDTVTGALEDVPGSEDDQANQTSGRGRRRSRRAKSAD